MAHLIPDPHLGALLGILQRGTRAVPDQRRLELAYLLSLNSEPLVPRTLLLCPDRGREAPGHLGLRCTSPRFISSLQRPKGLVTGLGPLSYVELSGTQAPRL